jgi:peptidoglycan/xylan/chitin deacetylase (PgdA/CDA1 family)
MWKNEMALRNILGFFPTYMRPPYSACSAGCEEDMKELGYHITYFVRLPFFIPFSQCHGGENGVKGRMRKATSISKTVY